MSEQKRNATGITVSKAENFSEWYTQVVLKADLADYGPVQGSMAIRPTAYEMWERMKDILDSMLRETGHRNAYFPLLIPEQLLTKEAEHVEGFSAEVFWVTHNGNNEMGERAAVRPTSETVIYSFYSRWIRSWRDLPLLLNQWCNVLRAEIKTTKPFIRTSEFLWQEGHTVHMTKEEADKEVRMILGFYKKLSEDYLAVPVIAGMKSEREKFAGALYTTTIEAMMPDGKALQAATSHNLGQNFSKAFDIGFLDEKNERQFAWQTSWGISTRMLGALIMIHGDDKGLIAPPNVAPTQIVIVPIQSEDSELAEFTSGVASSLKGAGFRIHVDDRDNRTPGWKFNEWELRGVPLRIEIGRKEMEGKAVTLSRRDTGAKKTVALANLAAEVRSELESMQHDMFAKAKASLDGYVSSAATYDEFKKVLESRKGFIKAGWCGSPECEDKVKEETGATIRVVPFEPEKAGSCVYCGKPAKTQVYFARAY